MKIAILMLLHEYNEQQKNLINHLSKDFDVYIHVDKRSKINIQQINSKNVFAFEEYKVYWGHFNIVLATLFLLRKASEKKYDRYLLVSGQDMPLKSTKDIYAFFDNNTNEYLCVFELPHKRWTGNGGFDRVDYYYPKSFSRGNSNLFRVIFSRIIRKINRVCIIPMLKLLKIHRRRIKGIKYYGGSEWFNLTHNCVSQILSFLDNNENYYKSFKHTDCSDEVFFQTLICNYVKNVNLVKSALRYDDWQTGPEYPRILRVSDYEKLRQTDFLFARKFNASIDNDIILKLYNDINS